MKIKNSGGFHFGGAWPVEIFKEFIIFQPLICHDQPQGQDYRFKVKGIRSLFDEFSQLFQPCVRNRPRPGSRSR